MRIGNYSFPHPVLGRSDDVGGKFGVDYKVELGREVISLHCNVELKNKTLSNLVKEDKIEIICDLNCPYTLFRETKKIKDRREILKTDAAKLRGRVDVAFYIIAKIDIGGYHPKGLNIEYGNNSFDIKKGEFLAIDNNASYFIAEKAYEQFVSASSFMQVVKKEDVEKGPVDYEYDNDKIIIQLPVNDFDKYYEIYTDDSFLAVYHTVLALPALTIALHAALSEGQEEIKEKLWYQHILQIRENNENLKNIPWDKEYAVQLAQEVLKLPIYRSFENLSNHITTLDKQE